MVVTRLLRRPFNHLTSLLSTQNYAILAKQCTLLHLCHDNLWVSVLGEVAVRRSCHSPVDTLWRLTMDFSTSSHPSEAMDRDLLQNAHQCAGSPIMHHQARHSLSLHSPSSQLIFERCFPRSVSPHTCLVKCQVACLLTMLMEQRAIRACGLDPAAQLYTIRDPSINVSLWHNSFSSFHYSPPQQQIVTFIMSSHKPILLYSHTGPKVSLLTHHCLYNATL